MQALKDHLTQHFPNTSQDAISAVMDTFRSQTKQKGERLLTQGEVCRSLYFIAEGATRSYSLQDDQDITTWFAFKDEFITSFTSFFSPQPSYETIEMLTTGQVYSISRDQLTTLQDQSPEIAQIINHFTIQYAIQLEQRLFLIQTYTAREKYEQIIEREPHLVQDIPSKYLASYLGITRETLSRIRSRRN